MIKTLLFTVLLPASLCGALCTALVFALRPLLRRAGGRTHKAALTLAMLLFLLPLSLGFRLLPAPTATAASPAPTTVADALRAAPATAPAYQTGQALQRAAAPAAETPAPAQRAFPVLPVPTVLAGLYLAGVLLFAAWHAEGYWRFTRRLRASRRAPAPGQLEQLQALCAEMNIHCTPALYGSELVTAPLLVGAVRPTVVLPAQSLGEEALALALRHELTHLKQRDIPFKLAALFVTGLHWFNPLAHLLLRDASAACEAACDETVTRSMSAPQRRAYAGTLLLFAQNSLPYPTAGFAAPVHKLKKRMAGLLHPQKPGRAVRAGAALGLCAALAACLLVGCGVAAGAAELPSSGSGREPAASLLQLPAGSGEALTDAVPYHEDDAASGLGELPPVAEGASRYLLTTSIPYATEERPVSTLAPGERDVLKAGEAGACQQVIDVTLDEAGEVATQEVVATAVVRQPVDEIVLVGTTADAGSTPATPASDEAYFINPVPEAQYSTRGFVEGAHRGIDLNAPTGTPIVAANGGVVLEASSNESAGNYIVVDHGAGLTTRYTHCSELLALEGQVVDQGTVIAKVGSSGYSTGPHLHFEVLVDGLPVDPLDYITLPWDETA